MVLPYTDMAAKASNILAGLPRRGLGVASCPLQLLWALEASEQEQSRRISRGSGTPSDLEDLRDLCHTELPGHSFCDFGRRKQRPRGFIRHFTRTFANKSLRSSHRGS